MILSVKCINIPTPDSDRAPGFYAEKLEFRLIVEAADHQFSERRVSLDAPPTRQP